MAIYLECDLDTLGCVGYIGCMNTTDLKTPPPPGRYTVQVTVTVWANNRRDAYRQIQNALSRKNDGVEFLDAEDTRIEPFCKNIEDHGDYGDERDLAVDGTDVCAACLAETKVADAS